MVRISKQNRRRAISPRRHQKMHEKTGTLKDNLPVGHKEHKNALEGDIATQVFIPKIR